MDVCTGRQPARGAGQRREDRKIRCDSLTEAGSRWRGHRCSRPPSFLAEHHIALGPSRINQSINQSIDRFDGRNTDGWRPFGTRYPRPPRCIQGDLGSAAREEGDPAREDLRRGPKSVGCVKASARNAPCTLRSRNRCVTRCALTHPTPQNAASPRGPAAPRCAWPRRARCRRRRCRR